MDPLKPGRYRRLPRNRQWTTPTTAARKQQYSWNYTSGKANNLTGTVCLPTTPSGGETVDTPKPPWQSTQSIHYLHHHPMHMNKRWRMSIIQKLWNTAWDMWQHWHRIRDVTHTTTQCITHDNHRLFPSSPSPINNTHRFEIYLENAQQIGKTCTTYQ